MLLPEILKLKEEMPVAMELIPLYFQSRLIYFLMQQGLLRDQLRYARGKTMSPFMSIIYLMPAVIPGRIQEQELQFMVVQEILRLTFRERQHRAT